MRNFLDSLDRLGALSNENSITLWLKRTALIFLFVMTVAAPHSIAATQTAWLIGMTAWLAAVVFRKIQNQPVEQIQSSNRLKKVLGLLLWAFFVWSAISSLLSYEPLVSLDRLRGTGLFLIFFFVYHNTRTLHAVRFLAFSLIFSCMVNVLWMPIERLIGRGVQIEGVQKIGPLGKALLYDGDTLLTVNDIRVHSPEDVANAIEKNEISKVKFYRPDFEAVVDVKRADFLPGSASLELLGIATWSKSHNWRSKGFYGHYTTYADVLQLILSLVLGLIVAQLGRRRATGDVGRHATGDRRRAARDRLREKSTKSTLPILLFCLIAMAFALLLTVTRAPQLAFLISAFAIVLVGASRKLFFVATAVALPVCAFGPKTRDISSSASGWTQFRRTGANGGCSMAAACRWAIFTECRFSSSPNVGFRHW
ncbi:MAG: hypothetical protein LC734_03820 [Acidobacteria bacterium]|nr:hypothetical protein [Acidobacteriota bacterium]